MPECEERLPRQWQPRRSSTAPWDWLKITPQRALWVPICNNRCVCCYRREARLFSVPEVIYCILSFKVTICRTCILVCCVYCFFFVFFFTKGCDCCLFDTAAKPGKRNKMFFPFQSPFSSFPTVVCLWWYLSHFYNFIYHNTCAYRWTTKRKAREKMSSMDKEHKQRVTSSLKSKGNRSK